MPAATGRGPAADKRAPLVAVTGGQAGASLTITGMPEVCPVITKARFTVGNASFNATSGSGTTSWTANLHWDVSWDSTSNPSSLPLKLGNYMYANAATMSGGGSYTTTTHAQPTTTCSGGLTLGGPGTPGDALIKVTGDTTQAKKRTWTLQLRATDYDSFFPTGGDCTSPPFGDSSDSFGGHLWEATSRCRRRAHRQSTPSRSLSRPTLHTPRMRRGRAP